MKELYGKLQCLVAIQNEILQKYSYDEKRAMKDTLFLAAKKEADKIVSILQKTEDRKIIENSYLFSNETSQ